MDNVRPDIRRVLELAVSLNLITRPQYNVLIARLQIQGNLLPAPPQLHQVPGPAPPVQYQQYEQLQLELQHRRNQLFAQINPFWNTGNPVLQGLQQLAAASQATLPLFLAPQLLLNQLNPAPGPANVALNYLNQLLLPPPQNVAPPPQQNPEVEPVQVQRETVIQQRKRRRDPPELDVNNLFHERRSESRPPYEDFTPQEMSHYLYDFNPDPQYPPFIQPSQEVINFFPRLMEDLLRPNISPAPAPQNPPRPYPSADDRREDFKNLCFKYEYFKRNSPETAQDNLDQIYDGFLADREKINLLPVVHKPVVVKPIQHIQQERPSRVTKAAREDGYDSDSDDDEMEDNLNFPFGYSYLRMVKGWWEQFALEEVECMFPPMVEPLMDMKIDSIPIPLLPIQSITDVPIWRLRKLHVSSIHVTHSYRKIRILIRDSEGKEFPILEYWSTEGGCLFFCRNEFRFVKGTKYQTLAANHFLWISRNHRSDAPITTISFRHDFSQRFDPPIWPFGSLLRKIGKALGKQKTEVSVKDLILEVPKYEGIPEKGVEIFELILPHFRDLVKLELTTWDDRELFEARNIPRPNPFILLGEHFKPIEGSSWLEASTLSFEKRSFRLTEKSGANFDFLFHPNRQEIGLRLENWEFEQIIDVYDRKGKGMTARSCHLEDVLGVYMDLDQEKAEKEEIVYLKTDVISRIADGKIHVSFHTDEHNQGHLVFSRVYRNRTN